MRIHGQGVGPGYIRTLQTQNLHSTALISWCLVFSWFPQGAMKRLSASYAAKSVQKLWQMQGALLWPFISPGPRVALPFYSGVSPRFCEILWNKKNPSNAEHITTIGDETKERKKQRSKQRKLPLLVKHFILCLSSMGVAGSSWQTSGWWFGGWPHSKLSELLIYISIYLTKDHIVSIHSNFVSYYWLNRTVDWLSKVLATGEGILFIRRGLTIKRAAEPSNFANRFTASWLHTVYGMYYIDGILGRSENVFGGIKNQKVAPDEHRAFFVRSFTLIIKREVYAHKLR